MDVDEVDDGTKLIVVSVAVDCEDVVVWTGVVCMGVVVENGIVENEPIVCDVVVVKELVRSEDVDVCRVEEEVLGKVVANAQLYNKTSTLRVAQQCQCRIVYVLTRVFDIVLNLLESSDTGEGTSLAFSEVGRGAACNGGVVHQAAGHGQQAILDWL
ncbi:hypothetical protein N0V82_001360 [Gnomoniopsis sp. IMI 355080]|nr:hypothetical protein N0V82_001360 [Gnomoniopsis sp. IMI 355080]